MYSKPRSDLLRLLEQEHIHIIVLLKVIKIKSGMRNLTSLIANL